MSMALSVTTSNDLIADLEPLFTQATIPVNWLVVADDDPQMIEALELVLANESAAVLQVSQTEWDFADPRITEMIDWSLDHDSLEHLVLVGSSASELPRSSTSVARTSPKVRSESNYEKLVATVQHNQLRTREFQDRLADQVQQLFQIPLLNHRWASSMLAVYGLLYRADSGLFLAYDNRDDSYHPVIG